MKHLKQWVLRPLLLFMLFFALAPSASAWNYCGLKEKDASNPEVEFTWNDSGKYWEGKIPSNKKGKYYYIPFWDSGYTSMGNFGWSNSTGDSHFYYLTGTEAKDLPLAQNKTPFYVNTDKGYTVKVYMTDNDKSKSPTKVDFIVKTDTEESSDFEPYVIGFINSSSWQGADSSNAVKMEKQSDGTWKANNVHFQNENGKSVSYFRFYDKGNKKDYGPSTGGTSVSFTGSNSNTTTDASWSVAEGYYDIVFTESDKSFTIVKHDTSVTYTYQLKFGDDSLVTIEKGVDKTLTDLGGKSFQVVATPTTGSAITYGNNTTTSISDNVNGLALYEGQNAIALPNRTGNYTFKLNVGTDGKPTSIDVTVPGGSAPDPGPVGSPSDFDLYLYTEGYNNKQIIDFMETASGSNVYECVIKGDDASLSNKNIFFFPQNTYNSFGEKNGGGYEDYSPNGQHGGTGVDNAFELKKGNDATQMKAYDKYSGEISSIGSSSVFPAFKYNMNSDDITIRITKTGDNYSIQVVEKETPITLPTNKDRAGKYYLLGDVINDNYPSPAWEMKQEGDENTYIVQPFAMRKCKTVGVAVYDNDGVPTIVEPTPQGMPDVEGLPTHDFDGGGYFQPGVLCTAEYDPASNNLTFTRVNNDVTDYVPYVGILGERFTQATKYPTRHNNKDTMGEENYTMGDTKRGWQEAFIEYGNDGKPRFAFDGTTAYYNTVWPPRNNILMQSDLGEGITPLNISTAETTMRRDSRGVKSGSGWKTALSQDNNYYDGLDFGTDANKEYYRFYVNDMWMLGAFKIWTGWGGHKADRGTAEWENHWYWGPGSGDVDIKTGVTTLASKDGNFQTTNGGKDRVYYRTMEVFIPVDGDKLSRNNVKIYLTQTPGGAQIDSYVENKTTVDGKPGTGAYLPKLSADMPNGYDKITSYKIVRYQYVANTDISNLKQVGVDGKTYENKMDAPATEAVVKKGSVNFSSTTAFNNYFTNTVASEDGTINDGNGTDYVKDAGLVAGMYKYCMEVVFSGNDGTTETATVWSPYIRVFDDKFTLNATNGQLVKLNAEDSKKYNAHYLVYNEQNINNGMLVSLNDKNQVTIAKRLSTLFPGEGDQQAQKTREVATKIFQETGEWTNMVGFMTSAPEKFTSVEATARKINSIKLFRYDGTAVDADDRNADNVNWTNVETFTQLENFWFVIRDRELDLKTRNYEVKFDANITYQDKQEASAFDHKVGASAYDTYTPAFPLPYFGTPRVEIVKDAEGEKYEYTGTHGDIDAQETHQLRASELQVFVPVKMPNLVEKIRETVYGDLSISFNDKAAVSGKVPSAEENISDYQYGLQYRYQSPYDWVKESNTQTAASGLDPVDQCGWEARPHTWTIAASYKTGMKGLKHSLIEGKDPMTATASFTPVFTEPSASPVYYYELEKDNEGDGYHTTVYIKNYSVADIEDKIGGDSNKLPYGDKESLIMTHVTLQSGQSLSEGEALVNKHMTIGCAKEDSELHPIATKVIDKKLVADSNWKAIRDLMSTFLKKLQVEYGHVHLFKIGENPATSQSGFVGFTAAEGSFPYLRYDHQSPTNAPKRAASVAGTHANWTKEYIDGDNVLEFSPVYALTTIYDKGIATDVEDLADDMLNVEVGTGYIDMLGNDGRIFAADGREVYVGAGRAEVGQGVYMVVLPGKTLKVMVK